MIFQGLRGQTPHVMVCSCGHECADSCWHVPFGLWVYGKQLMSLGHDLHTGILPFQAQEYLAEEVDFGDFAGAQGAEPTCDGAWLWP